jgi:hypothetical protein
LNAARVGTDALVRPYAGCAETRIGSKLQKAMASHRLIFCALVFLCTMAVLSPYSGAQTTVKHLILKDGSYQLATSWEIKGDRVRYFSAERGEWEEIPNAMVDWDATSQYEKERVAGKTSPRATELDKELEAERQEEEQRSPHVAPGLRLPPEGGVYALDTYLNQPELVSLDQTSGEINRHVAHNVLRSAVNPVAGSKHTIELAGPSAKIQMHASLPTIYINIDSSAEADEPGKKGMAELPWDRFRIVRAQVKGDKRIVGAVKTAIYGKVSQEQQDVPATAEQVGEGWIKLTPKAPLTQGEYGLAEMLGKQGMNSYVWDFGVHPDAPANMAVIKPENSRPEKSVTGPAEPKLRR